MRSLIAYGGLEAEYIHVCASVPHGTDNIFTRVLLASRLWCRERARPRHLRPGDSRQIWRPFAAHQRVKGSSRNQATNREEPPRMKKQQQQADNNCRACFPSKLEATITPTVHCGEGHDGASLTRPSGQPDASLRGAPRSCAHDVRITRRRSEGCLLVDPPQNDAPKKVQARKSMGDGTRKASTFTTGSSHDEEDEVFRPRRRQSVLGTIKRLFSRKNNSPSSRAYFDDSSSYVCQTSRTIYASEGMDPNIIDIF